jgi:hypothetical protein
MKQNTPKLLIFLTCFLAFVLSPQACSAAEQSNTTSAYFDAHKDHLRKLVLLGQNEHLTRARTSNQHLKHLINLEIQNQKRTF